MTGSGEVVLADRQDVPPVILLRVDVGPEENSPAKLLCTFSYSANGNNFRTLGKSFVAREGKWVGAKVGLFADGARGIETHGHMDVNWFRITQ